MMELANTKLGLKKPEAWAMKWELSCLIDDQICSFEFALLIINSITCSITLIGSYVPFFGLFIIPILISYLDVQTTL